MTLFLWLLYYVLGHSSFVFEFRFNLYSKVKQYIFFLTRGKQTETYVLRKYLEDAMTLQCNTLFAKPNSLTLSAY